MNTAATDGGIYHNGRTYAEHCVWLDSLTGDDYRIVYMPPGHLFTLAMVSTIKRGLLEWEMTADERLKLLEAIASSVNGSITAEAVEALEPCCDTGATMLAEINSLPIDGRTGAFIEGDVFHLLAKLNPSLLTALRLCVWHEAVPENESV
jgi:hypothetical protein